MKKQVLSIKQMEYLNLLGIDTSKASMFYDYKYGNELDLVKYPDRLAGYISKGFGIGAFTLQDLLNLLPNVIDRHVFGFNQDIRYSDGDGCYVSYTSLDMPDEHLHVIDTTQGGLLSACYDMLIWVIKNNHLKTNNHDNK